MAILLTAACGYNPKAKENTDAGGEGSQAGAIAGGSAGTKSVPALDAALPQDISSAVDTGFDSADTGGTGGSDGTGGMAGSLGSGGADASDASGSTGAGGATLKQDAGPSPDTAVADAPVTCPALEAPANGQVVPTSLNVDGQASYTCSGGYALSSREVRKCQADGTWSGTAPTCLVDCGKPQAPDNGKIEAPTTTYQSSAVYSCNPGYALSREGYERRVCQENGTWSGTAPTCECTKSMCGGACVDLTTDNANCGDCGKVCSTVSPSTAQCTSTGCLVTLVRGKSQGSIVVDSTYVYWADLDTSMMKKVPLGGGEPTILAQGESNAGHLVIDATHLYWMISNQSIRALPLAGGTPFTMVSGMGSPTSLATSSTHLYYLKYDGIYRVPLTGGEPTVFAPITDGMPRILVLDSTNAYWVTDVSTGVSRIMKKPLAVDSAPATLATTRKIQAIAVDATHVYWTEPEDSTSKGSVWKAPIAGGEATILASALDLPSEIAVDAKYVTWINNLGGQVMRIPITGGTPTLLISNRWLAAGLKLDATSVYWTELRNDTSQTTSSITKLTPR